MSFSWVPPVADPFLARAQVMADMAAWVERCRTRHSACLMYVHGLEGLGVSCLVTQFSKQYHGLIEGRLVWLTGRRADGSPIPLGELLTRASRQLGVSDADQVATEAEQVDVYRAACKHKKFMLVLDDMAVLGQVVNLIPEDAPGAIIVITTPFERRTLEAYGFKPFTPEFLPTESAHALFNSVLGETAEHLAPTSVEALVELCGGLPLVIKVLAAQIRGRAHLADRLLSRFRALRLSVLALDDEKRMTKFLDTTYQDLNPLQAQAYRRLGWLPATDFTAEAAAAALGTDPDDICTVLEDLTELHLLERTTAGRYAFHPVLRDDARTRADADDEGTVLDGIRERWVTSELHELLPRAAVVSNRWWVPPVHATMARHYGSAVPEFSRAEALAWFEIEAPNLIAAVQIAHRHGLHTESWTICVLLWKYLHINGFHDAWIETHRAGLASARAAGSELGVMQLALQLGAAYLEVGQHSEADRCFSDALTIARRHRHGLGEQSALEWLGKTAARQGNTDIALDYFQQSWDAAASASDIEQPDMARVFAILGLQQTRAKADSNRWDGLIEQARTVSIYFDQFDNETDNRAKIRMVLGRGMLAQGDPEGAADVFRAAAELFEAENARRHQADAERMRGNAFRATHRLADAASSYRIALDLYLGVGSPLAGDVAAALAQIENS
ncbi:hypothetical protein GFY24_30165 [Nocardia sp. SYP-A9097]|uniref:tetratricopeptide repeat protein n=1 Tax=Nocardia sp. SYP-A9097 TaxID=2663237 RepID=UPI00129ACF28|nr:tetratricopeptide repeat protein [Nocardia sp. SYP-A9097]MRH91655.1 hypothetical protein [Nocardia sp. SYP-A9097]